MTTGADPDLTPFWGHFGPHFGPKMGPKMGPKWAQKWVHFRWEMAVFGVQKWPKNGVQNGPKNGVQNDPKKGSKMDPLKTPLKTAFSGSGQKGPILAGKTKGSRSGLFCHRQKGSKVVKRGQKVGTFFDHLFGGPQNPLGILLRFGPNRVRG